MTIVYSILRIHAELGGCQLGVDNRYAIQNGRLANVDRFFGDNNAEVIAVSEGNGGWNGGRLFTNTSGQQWNSRGGGPGDGPGAGISASYAESGAVYYYTGHRTILSGY
jgi:hypothetical protein